MCRLIIDFRVRVNQWKSKNRNKRNEKRWFNFYYIGIHHLWPIFNINFIVWFEIIWGRKYQNLVEYVNNLHQNYSNALYVSIRSVLNAVIIQLSNNTRVNLMLVLSSMTQLVKNVLGRRQILISPGIYRLLENKERRRLFLYMERDPLERCSCIMRLNWVKKGLDAFWWICQGMEQEWMKL